MFSRTKTSSTMGKCQKEKENKRTNKLLYCAYTHEYLPPEFFIFIYRVFEIFRDISLNPQIVELERIFRMECEACVFVHTHRWGSLGNSVIEIRLLTFLNCVETIFDPFMSNCSQIMKFCISRLNLPKKLLTFISVFKRYI